MGYLIAMMVLGLLLVLVEVFLTPGIGVAGVFGILSMGGASYYAFYGFNETTGYVVTGLNLFLLIILTVIFLRARAWEKMSLKTNIDAKALEDDSAIVHKGDIGCTTTRLAPMGMVRIGDLSVEAKAMEGMIDPGVKVEVMLVENKKIYVSPVCSE